MAQRSACSPKEPRTVFRWLAQLPAPVALHSAQLLRSKPGPPIPDPWRARHQSPAALPSLPFVSLPAAGAGTSHAPLHARIWRAPGHFSREEPLLSSVAPPRLPRTIPPPAPALPELPAFAL